MTSDSSLLYALDAKSGAVLHSLKTQSLVSVFVAGDSGRNCCMSGSTQGKLVAVDLVDLTSRCGTLRRTG